MKINVKLVLSEAISFYKENFKNLAGLSFLISFVLFLYMQGFNYMQPISTVYPSWSWLYVLLFYVIMIWAIIVLPKLYLAMPILINSFIGENKLTMKQAYRLTAGKYWLYIGNSFLIGILYLPITVIILMKIPFAGAINPIYIALVTSLFYTLFPMIAIEQRTTRYLRKSVKMIKGNYFAALMLNFITESLLAVVYGALIYIVQGKLIESLIVSVIYAIAYFFVYPFSRTVSVVVYKKLKDSQEPFEPIDVENVKHIYCRNCGKEIDENAPICIYCGLSTSGEKPRRKFYTAGFVLGILSLCLPMHGLILGIIGLPMAIISKRKSSIIMNIIGIVIWMMILALIFYFLPIASEFQTKQQLHYQF